MAADLIANNAATTLAVHVLTTPAAGTAETWTLASTALPLPQITAGEMYRVTVGPATDTDPEIVWATAILVPGTNGTVTVLRGQEGSTVKTHQAGDPFTNTVTAGYLTGLSLNVNTASAAWVKVETAAFDFSFASVSSTDTGTGLPLAGNIIWPDGTAGTFTGTTDGVNGYTGYVAVYSGSTTRTATASGITYTAEGIALGPTSVVMS